MKDNGEHISYDLYDGAGEDWSDYGEVIADGESIDAADITASESYAGPAETTPVEQDMAATEVTPLRTALQVAEAYGAIQPDPIDGYVNAVVVVDGRCVVKVPQDGEAFRVRALHRERDVLEKMDGADLSPFIIPRLEAFSAEPLYLVASHVPGDVLKAEDIQRMPEAARDRFGRSLAEYILRQQEAGAGKLDALGPLSADEGWDAFFDPYVGGFSDPRYPTLTAVTQELYHRWEAYKASDKGPAVFIHDDLRPDNMTIAEDGTLRGVFDFSRAHVGSLEEEASSSIAIDPIVTSAFQDELLANGRELNVEQAMLWRTMKDIITLPYCIRQNDTSRPIFNTRREIIVARYPHLNWEELYR